MTRNKLLYVTKAMPNPTSAEAGYKMSFNLLEYLANRYDVSLISFTNGPADATTAAEYSLKLHQVITAPSGLPRKLLNVLWSPRRPVLTSLRYDHTFASRLRAVLHEWKPDVVWVEFTQMARYITVIRSAAPKSVAILYEHDVSAQMAFRRAAYSRGISRLLWAREARLLEREEPQLCNQFDLVCAPTEKDIDLLTSSGVDSKRLLRVVGFLLRNEDAAEWRDPGQSPASLLFVGSLSRFENAEAVRRLARKIMPLLRREFPGLKVNVVGRGEMPLKGELKDVPDVVFTGFVPSVLEIARQCHVAIFPLTLGAGVKVKVLEAMAWGMPVVTTSVGAEGIGAVDKIHMEIADDDTELAHSIGRLLRDPSWRTRLGGAGQKLCRREFDFSREMVRLQARLDHLVREQRHV